MLDVNLKDYEQCRIFFEEKFPNISLRTLEEMSI